MAPILRSVNKTIAQIKIRPKSVILKKKKIRLVRMKSRINRIARDVTKAAELPTLDTFDDESDVIEEDEEDECPCNTCFFAAYKKRHEFYYPDENSNNDSENEDGSPQKKYKKQLIYDSDVDDASDLEETSFTCLKIAKAAASLIVPEIVYDDDDTPLLSILPPHLERKKIDIVDDSQSPEQVEVDEVKDANEKEHTSEISNSLQIVVVHSEEENNNDRNNEDTKIYIDDIEMKPHVLEQASPEDVFLNAQDCSGFVNGIDNYYNADKTKTTQNNGTSKAAPLDIDISTIVPEQITCSSPTTAETTENKENTPNSKSTTAPVLRNRRKSHIPMKIVDTEVLVEETVAEEKISPKTEILPNPRKFLLPNNRRKSIAPVKIENSNAKQDSEKDSGASNINSVKLDKQQVGSKRAHSNNIASETSTSPEVTSKKKRTSLNMEKPDAAQTMSSSNETVDKVDDSEINHISDTVATTICLLQLQQQISTKTNQTRSNIGKEISNNSSSGPEKSISTARDLQKAEEDRRRRHQTAPIVIEIPNKIESRRTSLRSYTNGESKNPSVIKLNRRFSAPVIGSTSTKLENRRYSLRSANQEETLNENTANAVTKRRKSDTTRNTFDSDAAMTSMPSQNDKAGRIRNKSIPKVQANSNPVIKTEPASPIKLLDAVVAATLMTVSPEAMEKGKKSNPLLTPVLRENTGKAVKRTTSPRVVSAPEALPKSSVKNNNLIPEKALTKRGSLRPVNNTATNHLSLPAGKLKTEGNVFTDIIIKNKDEQTKQTGLSQNNTQHLNFKTPTSPAESPSLKAENGQGTQETKENVSKNETVNRRKSEISFSLAVPKSEDTPLRRSVRPRKLLVKYP